MDGHTVIGRVAGWRQSGFSLLGLLFVIAGLGIAMAALGTMWHTSSQREKELELLFVGNQYQQAIENFWNKSPGADKRLPKRLDELVSDPRFPNQVRHLRRIYRDPMTGSSEWGLLKQPDGGIWGVHSLSERTPFKITGFAAGNEQFKEAKTYAEWVFRFDVEKAQEDIRKQNPPAQKPGPSTGAAQASNPEKSTP